ncbi:hypothetical protein TWF481_001563 [Arthrobotrys musiformis]|uniref:Rieske domain-containing protein n=1 Tax=Arthrobotrys musiformis TaxID=47236 RepID=A0AAV9VUU7_9PEZI
MDRIVFAVRSPLKLKLAAKRPAIVQVGGASTVLQTLIRIRLQASNPLIRHCFHTATVSKMPQYKLTGVDKSDLKPTFKQEVTVEGLGDTKLLLVQVGQNITALSPRCTHYGAPLVKGTLTPSGRLKCPWHGACFNAVTGDIEDAPALDSLNRFLVTIDGDDLVIEAEESKIREFSRAPTYTCKQAALEDDVVVIVGGGSGAIGSLEALREYGYEGKIVVLSKESYPPIDRTKLSKALITDPNKIAWRTIEFLKGLDVDFHPSTVVKGIDFEKRFVETDQGRIFNYKKVILATGATPKILPLKGFKELGNIFTIRTIDTAKAIVDAVGLEGGKKIVVIGSSFIGMEVANFLVGKKHEVIVVGMEDVPMERVMGKLVGASFQSILEKKGVKFYMKASVEAAEPSSSNPSLVGSVTLKDGVSFEADAVILGVGVAPATEYIRHIPLERDGSVRVDESFQINGVKDAYAIGDIATYPYEGPGSLPDSVVRIEHWNVAQNSGRSVAKHIATGETAGFFTPIFWSALGLQLRYCGSTVSGYDDVVIDGNLEENKFVAYYTQGETVVAVASMQRDPIVMQCSELMRTHAMPSKTELQNGSDVMKIQVPN